MLSLNNDKNLGEIKSLELAIDDQHPEWVIFTRMFRSLHLPIAQFHISAASSALLFTLALPLKSANI